MLFRYLVWLFRFIKVKNVASISLLVIGSNYLTTAIANNTSISPTTNYSAAVIPNNTSILSTTSSNHITTAISNNITDKDYYTHFSTDKTISDSLTPITLYRAIRSTLNDTGTKTMTDHSLTRPYRPTTVLFHSDTSLPVKNTTRDNSIKKIYRQVISFFIQSNPLFPCFKNHEVFLNLANILNTILCIILIKNV
ncbi:BA71V-I196L (k15L) [African swine fever virus]|uniref:BA71V-I196L (K15L) n=1 Tax=African swine fever virus TaxID=10497 RepID=A0A0C5AZM9_ASF|nr:BA71V-I196L (k15L) [African swine fever virus]AJL34155.1 BA71V-I196L (k15L) [African swine fever virus]